MIFWNSEVHLIPGLDVGDKEIHLRMEPTGIVEAACGDSDPISGLSLAFPAREARSTCGAKTAFMQASSRTGSEVVAQSALGQAERGRGHEQGGDKSAASHSLTVSTVALEHQDWFCRALITDGATDAATSEG